MDILNSIGPVAGDDQTQALIDRIEVLDDFFDNANIPLRLIDREGKIIKANQAELDLLGYAPENYIGTSIAAHHVDPTATVRIMDILTRDGSLVDYPAFLKKADGSIVQVLINSSIYKKNGRFIHTRCLTRNVTAAKEEEKRSQQLLSEIQRHQQMLNMALDAASMGTWEMDLHTHHLQCSGHCRQILGIPADQEITIASVQEFIEPADLQKIKTAISDALVSKERATVDFRINNVDSMETRYLQAQGKVYTDSSAATERCFGTLIDITDAVLATEKSAKLAAIIESSDDAIISKSLDSIVTSWNDSAQRMFGYAPEEIIGESITKLIPEDRLDEEPKIIAKLKKGERVDHFETIRRTKDGRLLDISLTISPICNQKGEIIGVSKIARDITEQKKEQIRKNDFVAMVSHELKTPLTSMLGYIQVLIRKTKGTQNEFVNNALSKTEAQVKKMMGMVHDFLNVSRLEEGRIHLNKTVFELYPLVQEVVGNLQLVSPSHHIEFDVPQGVYVYGDSEKIDQVITNLLTNAVKYSPNTPEININCEVINDRAHLSVSDRGIGISQSDQQKLFDRFYRVDQTGQGQQSGFGIGLYLVAELLRMHHSEIKVESTLGEGAKFFFDLAIVPAPGR